jgi:IS605 OrfB family transposase
MMELIKTVTAKVFNPTTGKQRAIVHLWDSWKRALGLKRDYAFIRSHSDLPSYYCREINWKIDMGADAPVGIPKDCLKLLPGGTYAPWFASIPTPDGRVCLPLRMSKGQSKLLSECEVCDSQLIKRDKEFFLHIVVSKKGSIPIIPFHAPVLAVDLGERVIATSVALVDGQICTPGFHGREIRSIRRHYAWLRKRLGRKKLFRVIKYVGRAEHRKVDARLHIIASNLVEQARDIGAVIAIGDLYSIRKYSKGKRMNRIVNAMPFNRLSTFIEYKAAWAGVPLIKIDEAYSSRECHICKQNGRRPSQGRFICSSCGEYNADINGAVNIGNRALAYMAIAGASRIKPLRGTQNPQIMYASGIQ